MRTASLGVLAVTCYSATAFIPAPNARFVGTSVARTRAQRPVAASPLRMVEAGGGNENEKLNSLQAFSTELAKKFAVGAAIAAMAFAAPGDALAARSGGRMGGSSFSSPSRSYSSPSRSYSSPSRSYSSPSRSYGGGTTVVPVPVPSYGYGLGSPFGFSPFGGSPFGFSPFGTPGVSFYGRGFGINPVDLLVLGGVAYGVTQLVKGGGSSFGNLDDSPPSSLGEGVDVLKLQVAINCRDRSRNSILGVLEDLSNRGDTETKSGLAEVVSEVGLALARRSADWMASASALEHFNNRNAERAEATFSQYAVQVRTKIERETKVMIGGRNMSSERSGGASQGGPTVAVVSLVLALRGDSLKRLGLDRGVSSMSGVRAALEAIASGSLSDGGENVLGAEVLWTPEEPSEVLTREDVVTDFPELIDL
ncbi:unnamed protein product [Ascophyllum nodosum]